MDRRQKRRDQESSIGYIDRQIEQRKYRQIEDRREETRSPVLNIYIDKQYREKIDRQKIKEKRLRFQYQIYRQVDTKEKRQMDRIEKKRDRWKIEEKRLGVEYD